MIKIVVILGVCIAGMQQLLYLYNKGKDTD